MQEQAMARKANKLPKGQSIIEYMGSLVLTAVVVAVTWQVCHFAMPGLFTAVSQGMASYYHTD